MGDTWYDSLQIKLTKRYSHGLTAQVAYTWSKSLTNAANSNTSYLTPNDPVLNDPFNLPTDQAALRLRSAAGAGDIVQLHDPEAARRLPRRQRCGQGAQLAGPRLDTSVAFLGMPAAQLIAEFALQYHACGTPWVSAALR